eukprot:scaffold15833_cov54-Phaeocystis_antarctica.AAC.1
MPTADFEPPLRRLAELRLSGGEVALGLQQQACILCLCESATPPVFSHVTPLAPAPRSAPAPPPARGAVNGRVWRRLARAFEAVADAPVGRPILGRVRAPPCSGRSHPAAAARAPPAAARCAYLVRVRVRVRVGVRVRARARAKTGVRVGARAFRVLARARQCGAAQAGSQHVPRDRQRVRLGAGPRRARESLEKAERVAHLVGVGVR